MTHDGAQPYFWADEDIAAWLTDAERHACIRGRLLREDSNPAICSIALNPVQHTYELHPTVYELIHARCKPSSGKPRRLCIATRELLDAQKPQWRDDESPAWGLIQDDTTVRIAGKIATGDELQIECYRLPLRPLSAMTDKPEIHPAHHEHLLQWALHRAFEVVDAETLDSTRAVKAEQEFTKYFGMLPDSDLRRDTRFDVVQHNRADFSWRGR